MQDRIVFTANLCSEYLTLIPVVEILIFIGEGELKGSCTLSIIYTCNYCLWMY